MKAALDRRVDGVNAVWRKHQPGEIKIRSGETQFATEFVAAGHSAGEGVGATEHLAGGIEATRPDRLADARAADDFSVEGNRCQPVHDEVQFLSQLLQQGDIPAPPVTEGERAADAQAVDRTEVSRQAANELLARNLAERLVEANQQRGVDSQRFDDAQLFRERVNQRRIPFRSDDGIGVTVECDGKGDAFVLAGVLDGLPDYLLMPEMYAVKHPHGHAHLARPRIQFADLGDDLHRFCDTERTGHASGLARQFQERNYALFELGPREGQDVVQRQGIRHGEPAGGDAAQRGQVGAATEFLPEIMRERADVGAFGACDAELAEGILVAGEPKAVDVNEPFLTLDFNA